MATPTTSTVAKQSHASRPTLTVRSRPAGGTTRARRLRQEGIVPGIVYGRQLAPVTVSVDQQQLSKLVHSAAGEHALITLRMEQATPASSWEQPALVKAIQYDPVTGSAVHVDFHAIVLTERLKVKVGVVLKGEPVGVKQDGGILEQFLREVEVECLPTDIPVAIEHDISALAIGQTIHVRDLTIPASAKLMSEPEGVIASVKAPNVEQPEEAAAAPTEPEVLREKKPEEAAAAGDEAKGGGAKADKSEKEKPESKS